MFFLVSEPAPKLSCPVWFASCGTVRACVETRHISQTAGSFPSRGTVMANRLARTPGKDMELHIGDCYVWSEIHYLDSSTDYRESLLKDVEKPLAGREDLTMLDSSSVCWPGVYGLAIVFLSGIVGTGCLVYLALTGY